MILSVAFRAAHARRARPLSTLFTSLCLPSSFLDYNRHIRRVHRCCTTLRPAASDTRPPAPYACKLREMSSSSRGKGSTPTKGKSSRRPTPRSNVPSRAQKSVKQISAGGRTKALPVLNGPQYSEKYIEETYGLPKSNSITHSHLQNPKAVVATWASVRNGQAPVYKNIQGNVQGNTVFRYDSVPQRLSRD